MFYSVFRMARENELLITRLWDVRLLGICGLGLALRVYPACCVCRAGLVAKHIHHTPSIDRNVSKRNYHLDKIVQ